jgi:hypothetical protein
VLFRSYWSNRLAGALAGKLASKQTHPKSKFSNDYTNDVSIPEQRFAEAKELFAKAANRHEALREDHIDTLIAKLSSLQDPESMLELKALKSLQRKEKQKQVFSKLRRILKPVRSGTISRVVIPSDMADHLAKEPTKDPNSPVMSTSPKLTEICREPSQRNGKMEKNGYQSSIRNHWNVPFFSTVRHTSTKHLLHPSALVR